MSHAPGGRRADTVAAELLVNLNGGVAKHLLQVQVGIHHLAHFDQRGRVAVLTAATLCSVCLSTPLAEASRESRLWPSWLESKFVVESFELTDQPCLRRRSRSGSPNATGEQFSVLDRCTSLSPGWKKDHPDRLTVDQQKRQTRLHALADDRSRRTRSRLRRRPPYAGKSAMMRGCPVSSSGASVEPATRAA